MRFLRWVGRLLSGWWENGAEATIYTNMWVNGYSDWEIDQEIAAHRRERAKK